MTQTKKQKREQPKKWLTALIEEVLSVPNPDIGKRGTQGFFVNLVRVSHLTYDRTRQTLEFHLDCSGIYPGVSFDSLLDLCDNYLKSRKLNINGDGADGYYSEYTPIHDAWTEFKCENVDFDHLLPLAEESYKTADSRLKNLREETEAYYENQRKKNEQS